MQAEHAPAALHTHARPASRPHARTHTTHFIRFTSFSIEVKLSYFCKRLRIAHWQAHIVSKFGCGWAVDCKKRQCNDFNVDLIMAVGCGCGVGCDDVWVVALIGGEGK
jgi:hypothetical protein